MANSLEMSRKEVRELIRQRGRRKYNIWNGYAPKGGVPFNVKGTPRYLHLMWMEGDPSVRSYTLFDEKLDEKDKVEDSVPLPDAICIMSEGNVEWRLVRCNEDSCSAHAHKERERILTQQARQSGSHLRVITDDVLNKQMTLIRNWRLGLGYMNSVNDFDLAPYEKNVLLIIGEQCSSTMEQILISYPNDCEPFLIAATFTLLQKGFLESDLEINPFGLNTLIKKAA